jgi:hypothetical protein
MVPCLHVQRPVSRAAPAAESPWAVVRADPCRIGRREPDGMIVHYRTD